MNAGGGSLIDDEVDLIQCQMEALDQMDMEPGCSIEQQQQTTQLMPPIVVRSTHIAPPTTTKMTQLAAAAAEKKALLDRGFGLVVLSQTGYQSIRNLTNLSLVQHTKSFQQYHLRCTGFNPQQQQTIWPLTDLEVVNLFCIIGGGGGAGEIFKITRLRNGVVFVVVVALIIITIRLCCLLNMNTKTWSWDRR